MSRKYKYCLLIWFAVFALPNQLFSQAPVINTISKQATYPGDKLVITGAGFNPDKTRMKVWFGAVAGTVLSSSAFSMEVLVPVGSRVSNIEIINLDSRLSVRSNIRFAPYFSGSGFSSDAFVSPPYVGSGDFRTFASGPEHYDVCSCDFDGDGKPDLAASKYNSDPRIRVLRNTSVTKNLSFTELNFSSGTQVTDRVICGDLNGDGKPEIVASPSDKGNKNIITILPNNSTVGSIAFLTAQQIILPSSKAYVRTIIIRDLNNDGKPELIAANSYKPTTGAVAPDDVSPFYIYINQSSGGVISFNPVPIEVALPRSFGTYSIDIQDFDGNGLPDIAIAEFQGNSIYFIPNNSTNFISLGSVVTRQINNAVINKLVSADLNGDGKSDLAVTDFFNDNVVVFLNNRTNQTISFGNPLSYPAGDGPDGLDITDFDGDRDLDLVVGCRNEKKVSVFINDGSANAFYSKIELTTSKNIRNLLAGDLDGDAKPDLALVTFNTPTSEFSVDVLRNRSCFIPAIVNAQPLTNCEGQPVDLETIPGYGVTYDWKKDGLLVSSTTLPSLTVTQAGTYTVTAVGECNAASATSVSVTLSTNNGNVPLTPTISGNTSVCEGSTINLSTNVISGATYNWTGPGGFASNQSSITRTNSTGLMSGEYQLQIIQGFCKSEVVSKIVEVVNLSTFSMLSASSTNSLCQGSTLELSVADFNGYLYQWKKDGSNIAAGTSARLSVSTAGSYSVVVSSGSLSGCNKELSPPITIKILQPPVSSFTAPTPACTGAENIFVNTSTIDPTGSALVNFNWDFGIGGSFVGQTPPKVNFQSAQPVNVSLKINYTGVQGCEDTETKSVSVAQTVIPVIQPETLAICPESPQDLSVSGSFQSLIWNDGSTGLSLKVNQAGDYTVTTVDQNGCISFAALNVTALPIPVVKVTADRKNISAGETVALTATGADAWVWEPVEILDNPTSATPIAKPLKTTKFIAKGFLNAGCSAKDSVEIQVDGDVVFPNAFSPNGDGVHDLWQIPSPEAFSDCFLTIFDRSGRRVFEQKGYTNDWEGRYNGRLLPEGIYYYVMGCPDRPPLTGNILLFR